MKKSRHHRGRMTPINTLKELQDEKFRLQRELLETEENLKDNYQGLVDALTFRNIINTIAEEIVSTNLIVSQAYSIIKPLFKRKKKKKRDEEPGSVVEELGSEVEELGSTDEG